MNSVTLTIAEYQALVNKVDLLNAMNLELEENMDTVCDENRRVGRNYRSLLKENEDLKKENLMLKTTAASASSEELLNMMNGMKLADEGQESKISELEAMKKEMDELMFQRNHLQFQVLNMCVKQQHSEEQLTIVTNNAEEQKVHAAAYQAHITVLEYKLAGMQAKGQEQQASIQKINDEKRILEVNLKAVEDEVLAVTTKNKMLEKEISNTNEEADKIRNELKEKEEELKEKDDELNARNKKDDQNKKKLETLKMTVKMFVEKNQEKKKKDDQKKEEKENEQKEEKPEEETVVVAETRKRDREVEDEEPEEKESGRRSPKRVNINDA